MEEEKKEVASGNGGPSNIVAVLLVAITGGVEVV